ncbi:hypothetical protein C3L33_03811, partial [Rhododendron williamsianum]
MASLRRLLPLRSLLLGKNLSASGICEGLGGGFRGYSASLSPEERILKLEEDDQLAEDDIAKIRAQFDAAKQSFFKIPEAVKEMPKMHPKGIYVNKNLKLEDIQVYGFDYDYTLAHYSSNLQTLIYELAKEHLVNELTRKEIEQIYGTRHIGRDQARGLVSLMDFFCFSEACLLADIVQHFVDAKLEFDASHVYEDVNCAIQHVHRSGLAHNGILSDPQRYLVKNVRGDESAATLSQDAEAKGEETFLVDKLSISFCGWRDAVYARGDSIFASFYCFARASGYFSEMSCYDIEKDTLAFSKVDTFLPNKVYYHGCLKSFLQITKWIGPEVIYFGDHLFSDLRGPSKAGWRTAAIIHELENEIHIQNEDSYRFEQAKFHIIQELLGKLHATVANSQRREAFRSLLWDLNEERQKARCAMKNMFNRSFGATFLTDTGQESAFAYNIHRYADVYTSKPENFLFYPSEAWLHVPFDIKIMPHHVKMLRCIMILRSDDAMLSKEIVADVVRRILIQVGFAPIRLSPLLSILCSVKLVQD